MKLRSKTLPKPAAWASWPGIRIISEQSLVEGLRDQRGAKIITFVARTEPKMLAKHPETQESNTLRGNIFKISRVNGIIGWQYEASVNRQLERENKPANFQAEERAWGQRLEGTPLVEHKGAFYVEVKVERSLDHRYFDNDGELLDAAGVEQFMPRRGGTRQGVSRQIMLRDYAVSSIIWLKLDGITYIIRRGDALPIDGEPAEVAGTRECRQAA